MPGIVGCSCPSSEEKLHAGCELHMSKWKRGRVVRCGGLHLSEQEKRRGSVSRLSVLTGSSGLIPEMEFNREVGGGGSASGRKHSKHSCKICLKYYKRW